MSPLAAPAHALLDAGLSIIPVRADKRPTLDSWKPYQAQPADHATAAHWFTANGTPAAPALAIICGAVSGNLTVIDFDTDQYGATLYDAFAAIVEARAPGLLDRLVQVQTPSGGRHLYLRCTACEGNLKLALAADGGVRIETRGEGGYAVAPPSPGYRTVRGTLKAIPEIEEADYRTLLQAARALSEQTEIRGPAGVRGHGGEERPGDAYNARATLADLVALLVKHGWTAGRGQHGKVPLTRPGKDPREGISGDAALVGGIPIFTQFSANGGPFEPQKGYSPFAVYAILEHRGDYTAAARALCGQDAADGREQGRQQSPPPGGGAREEKARGQENQAGEERDAYAAFGPDWGREALPEEAQQPPLPLSVFADVPAALGLVRAGAAAIGCHTDYLVGAILGATAAAIGGSRQLLLGSHRVPAIVWIALQGRSGTGKSPALELAFDPIFRHDSDLSARHEQEVAAFDDELQSWQLMDKSLRGERPKAPQPLQILASDATLEALALVVRDNPRGIVLYRDELAGWLKSFNQYRGGLGSDREQWLSLYDGKPLRVDRKTTDHRGVRVRITVDRPVCSVIGTVQPSKLGPALGNDDDGLRERLLIAAPPHQMARPEPMGVTEEVIDAYRVLMQRLLALMPGDDGEPVRLTLQPAAQEFWRAELGVRWDAQRNDADPALDSWVGKLSGHAARLTLLVHQLRVASGGADPREVDARSAMAGWALLDAFEASFRVALGQQQRTWTIVAMERTVAWVRKHGGTATARDIVRANVGGIQTASQARAVFHAIEDHGHGRIRVGLAGHQEQMSIELAKPKGASS